MSSNIRAITTFMSVSTEQKKNLIVVEINLKKEEETDEIFIREISLTSRCCCCT